MFNFVLLYLLFCNATIWLFLRQVATQAGETAEGIGSCHRMLANKIGPFMFADDEQQPVCRRILVLIEGFMDRYRALGDVDLATVRIIILLSS
jgi:hypothetical protein